MPVIICLRATQATRSSFAKIGPIRLTASSTLEPFCLQMEIPCYLVALKIAAACRIFAPRVPLTGSMIGELIRSQR